MQFDGCSMVVQSVLSICFSAQAPSQRSTVTEHFRDLNGDVCRALCPVGVDPNLLPDSLCKEAYDFAPLCLRLLRDQHLPASRIFKPEQAAAQRLRLGFVSGLPAHHTP